MAKILTTDNLADIKAKAKKAIHDDINNDFGSFSAENPYVDPPRTNYIPIQTISFDAGTLSPNFIFYEKQAMYNPETYHAFVSVGDPKTNEDPLVWKFHDWAGPDAKMQDLGDAKYWPANSNVQTFWNKKNINVTLYFHNTFGTRGDPGISPDNAAKNAAKYIGKTGNSDYLGNYMKFEPSTGTLTVRTTGMS